MDTNLYLLIGLIMFGALFTNSKMDAEIMDEAIEKDSWWSMIALSVIWPVTLGVFLFMLYTNITTWLTKNQESNDICK